MNSYLAFILSILSAYLIGSFPTSFILAKVLKGIDIRQAGSKNPGATNVFRVVGKIPGLVTLVIDVLKGVATVTLVADFFYPSVARLDYGLYQTLLGFVVICGHIWSVFLKFRGGKGVATTLGVAIVVAPLMLLPAVILWIIIFFLTNYVSLASVAALISFPIITAILNAPLYIILLGVVIGLIGIYRHKENIKRLLRGEENKVKIQKSKI